MLTNIQTDNYINDLKLTINQQILNGFTMNELSEKNNLPIKNIKNAYPNSEEEDNLKNTIINTAFSQNKDFISDIYDFDINKSFIINVDEIYPSKTENIDDIFANVKSDFIKSKKLKYAENIFEKSNSDQDLEKINLIFKLIVEKLNINLNSKNLSTSLIKNIFETDLNTLTFSSDKNNVYFAMVNDIDIPAKTEIFDDIKLISELKNAFGNEIIKTKNISLNDELINGLLSQYK